MIFLGSVTRQCRSNNVVAPGIFSKYSFLSLRDLAYGKQQEFDGKCWDESVAYYASRLRECASAMSLYEGRCIHHRMVKSGHQGILLLGNLLILMYGKCNALSDAFQVFHIMDERNVFTWNIMIGACAQCGCLEDVKQLFEEMPEKDVVAWNAMITAYAKFGDLEKARQTFDQMAKRNVVSWNAMIAAYAQCGNLEDASRLFCDMPERNVASWNTMIAGFAERGLSKAALHVFQQMQLEGIKPNKVTYLSIITSCSKPANLTEGKQIHELLIDSGLVLDVVLGTALINMYGKCGSMEYAHAIFAKMSSRNIITWNALVAACVQCKDITGARKTFDDMPERNLVSWNTMIAGYVQCGYSKKAIKLFQQMELEGLTPDKITYVSVLNACADEVNLSEGKQMHERVKRSGVELDIIVGSSLIHMYGKCGCIEYAQEIFDQMRYKDVICWTTMITACSSCKSLERARLLFDKMPQRNIVSWNAMLAAYAQCGNLEGAQMIFDEMPQRDVASWNAMISVYAQEIHGKDAFQLFQQMQLEHVMPDEITYVSIIDACASKQYLAKGKEIHKHVLSCGFETNIMVGTALVNMYAECGNLKDASKMFKEMSQRNEISWNTMITAYAQHGHGDLALNCFRHMQVEGVNPDDVTFLSLLNACSHIGFIDEGFHLFAFLIGDHAILPTLMHYDCMIDLLGRAGQIADAEDFIENMMFVPNSMTWATLLGACRKHGDVDRGSYAAGHAFKLDPGNTAPHILLSHLYAATGRRSDGVKTDLPWKKPPCKPIA